MKILVTNPTGRIGSGILRELVAPEFAVRVIVRDPSRLPLEIRQQVEIVRGSMNDASALSWALQGMDSVFWCVPPADQKERNVVSHYERFAQAGWRAFRDAGTPRVVSVSCSRAGRESEPGISTGLHVMEQILNQAGAAIRHLRCGWFMDNLLEQAVDIRERGVLSYPFSGQIPLPMIAVDDVVDLSLKFLVRRQWEGIGSITGHGPEDLTFCQAAEILEQTLKREVRYQQTLTGHFIQEMITTGANPSYAHSQVEFFSQLARSISDESNPPVFRTSTTLRSWAERQLASLSFETGCRQVRLFDAIAEECVQ